ncbi:uncharacterized protein LOC113499399 [Trichoplusia ni]|uniref:Uncharacterized protein LOC113499399 n=1 Tax=Trichoplusia ni TaxID=7111 RepID=A0A7E5W4Y3_TRINI|nr:uncharacterized protein LOC113499399 [Trichoplusia ni]
MQLADVLCYIFLTITVTASCVGADNQMTEVEDSQPERKISKREATVIIDNNYPMERIFQKPKVIYRRISKQRYGPPKPKYGPPRPKYRPPKVTRKPGKKNGKLRTKPTTQKYGPPHHNVSPNKKRAPNSRYNSLKARPNGKPSFGHVVKMPHYAFFVPDENNFGEPPTDYLSDYQPAKQSYGEPPVDSYGAPLKTTIKDVHPTPQSFQETTHAKHKNRDLNSWNHKPAKNHDLKFAFSKKHPKLTQKQHDSAVVETGPPVDHEDLLVSEHGKPLLQDSQYFFRNQRPSFFTDTAKVVNRPWRPNKQQIDLDDEIIVGGRYAEPPARYVSKFQQNALLYDDDEAFSQFHGHGEGEAPSSATNSPYTNYKHSNMAFSPQNLNDVFSIVDK